MPRPSVRQAIDQTVREEWGRILAALTKSLGDIQLAEDCLQDAIARAPRSTTTLLSSPLRLPP